jgi:hypothetical protein
MAECIKRVGASGQISLGKEFAGRTVVVNRIKRNGSIEPSSPWSRHRCKRIWTRWSAI